jgi:8-oxo-dGTP diphosphatase
VHIVVVAAVIERDGRFLLTLRPEGTHLAHRWEFPGGKCDPHESHVEALRRELHEELDVLADVHEVVHVVTHAYDDRVVELHFYRCGISGTPKPMIGQQLAWVARDELAGLPFPEADAELIAHLAKGG